MPNLTIRFIDGSDVISKLITWTTDSLWCHTEALSRDEKHWIGAHAGTGIQARSLDWCNPIRERRYSIPVTDSQYEIAMTWLESKEGLPYDYVDIIGLAVHKRIGASNHEAICSAAMIELIMKTSLMPLNCLEGFSYMITPETLHLSPLFIGKCIYSFPV